jgi:hypothetical protein
MRHAVAAIAAAGLLLGGCANDTPRSARVPAASPASATPSRPAGNGVAELEPAAIVEKAEAALAAAKSYRVKGSIKNDNGTIGLDLKFRDTDVIGTMTFGKTKVELLRVGQQGFIRPDAAFLKASLDNAKQAESVMAVAGDRWVAVSTTGQNFAQVFAIADVRMLPDASGDFTKGDIQTIGGKRAIAVNDAGSDRLFVALEGEPYPLRIEGGIKSDGRLDFSDFGATFPDLKIPPASKVVEFGKLVG